jgi:putative ABC transport system permease protein
VAWSFGLGIVVSVALLHALARLIMFVARISPKPKDPRLRHALANLYRPGNQTLRIVYSLGLGLIALVAVSLVDGNIQEMVRGQMPLSAPSYFFVNVPSSDIDRFGQVVTQAPG